MMKIISNTYKTSDLNEACKKSLAQFFLREDIGFKQLATRENLWEMVAERAKTILSDGVEALAIVGIGGSSLGVEAIYLALQHKVDIPVVFFDSPDEVATQSKWKKIKALKTHFVVISKSGKTLETLSLTSWLVDRGVDFSTNGTVVSEPVENPLSNWAKENSVQQLPLPEDVGGRFSVLTPVGMLPAALMGLRIEDFRQGAEVAVKSTDSVAELMAASLLSFKDNKWLSQFWIYSQPLKSFGLWWQQLWAESLAKKLSNKQTEAPRVSTPMVCVGPNDQHSLLQQVVEGFDDKWLLFLKLANTSGESIQSLLFEEMDYIKGKTLSDILEAECASTIKAVEEYQVPTVSLEISSLSEKSMGYLFMYFQLLIAGLGESLDINAFDQPGVELSKKMARKILQN